MKRAKKSATSRQQFATTKKGDQTEKSRTVAPNVRPDEVQETGEVQERSASLRELPSVSELNCLPRWAIVAFLARCARRVQPLLPDKSKELTQLVDNAVGVAEEAADWGMDLGGAEVAAMRLVEESDRWLCRSDPAVVVAGSAAIVAALANIGNAHVRNALAEQAGCAMAAILDASTISGDWLRLAVLMTRDFEAIRKAAESENWDDNSKVGPTKFG